MNMRRPFNPWILAGLIAVALVAAIVSLRGPSSPDEPKAPAANAPAHANGKTAKAKPHIRTRRANVRPDSSRNTEKPAIEADDDELPPEDQAMLEAIEAALDKEDLEAARDLAAKTLLAKNTEVRQAMVDTLGWFGVKALPELTPFLADPDEDVREAAMNEWSMAVSDIDDEAEKLGVVELAMHVLNDEDALETISGEYIGTDEKLAVESLLRIIESNGSEGGIAKAKETYEFVTGDEFVDRKTAEKWIAEEYEPPSTEP